MKILPVILNVAINIFILTRQGNSQNHGDLRLVQQDVKNPDFTAGRLEIYINSTWGSICADNFDMHDADVACRQLGFSKALEVATSFHTPYGRGKEGPVWLDEVECKKGNLRHILSCSYVKNGDIDCDHFSDVAIKCSSAPPSAELDNLDIRLVGGSFKSQGTLEVHCNNSWAPVCPPQGTMLRKADGDAICRQLGYTASVSYIQHDSLDGREISPVSFQDFDCPDDAHDLSSCDATCEAEVYSRNGSVQYGCVFLECTHSIPYGSLRLSNGSEVTPGALGGRLEIFRNGKWGTVCSIGFDLKAANITCQQFGFPSALYYDLSEELGYGQGDEDVPILSGVDCSSQSKSIECTSSHVQGVTNCTHSDDVAIFCNSKSVDSFVGLSTAEPPKKLSVEVVVVLIVAPILVFIIVCACLSVYSIHFKLVPYDTMKKPASHGLYFTEYEGSCLTLNETNLEAMLDTPASLKLKKQRESNNIQETAIDKASDSNCSSNKPSSPTSPKDQKGRYTSMPTQHLPLPPIPTSSSVPLPSILGQQPSNAQLLEAMTTPSPKLHRKFTISNPPGPTPTSPITGPVPPPPVVKRNLVVRRKSQEQPHVAVDMTQPSLAEHTKASSSSSSGLVEDPNRELVHEDSSNEGFFNQVVQMRANPRRGSRKLSCTLSQISDVNLEAVAINESPIRENGRSSPTANSRTNHTHRVSFKLQ